MQIADAWGRGNLVSNGVGSRMRGLKCPGCQRPGRHLVSYANTPPNETDTALADDYGSNDQNLAAAAMFVVTSPGRVSLSGSG